MHPDAFRENRNARVIRVGWGETVSWAFVPNPLPPPLTYDAALLPRLADKLFESRLVTIPRAKDYVNVTDRSAHGIVEKLVQANILPPLGSGKYGRKFIAPEIFLIIGAEERE
jgi:hypothetical protein